MTAEPVPLDRFRDAVGRLDDVELARFVAAVWAARGYETERDGRRVTVERGDETREFEAHDGTGPFGRFSVSSPPSSGAVDADAVVTNVEADAAVDVAELHRTVLYGLSPSAADACCREHLGIPAREDPDPGDAEGAAAPAVVGLVLFLLLVWVGAGPALHAGRTAETPLGGPPVAPAADPLDTATATPEADPLATPDVVTVEGLVADHAASLSDSTYYFREEYVARTTDGNVRSSVVTVGCVSADRREFSLALTVRGSKDRFPVTPYRNATLAFYTDGERFVRAIDRQDVAWFEHTPPDEYNSTWNFFLLPEETDPLQSMRHVEIRTVETGPERAYRRVRGDSVTNPTAFENGQGIENAQNVTLVATVGPERTIRSYRVSYRATEDGVPISVVRRGEYWTVENGSISAPSWTDAAINASDDPDDSADRDAHSVPPEETLQQEAANACR